MRQSVITEIKSLYPQMNEAMQKIADYLIDTDEIEGVERASELAQRSGVSTASVSRFVKMMGYKEFRDFRLPIVLEKQGEEKRQAKSELNYNGETISGDAYSICKTIFSKSVRELEETWGILDFSLIQKVADLIHKARRIAVIGVGRSKITVEALFSRLYRIGYPIMKFSDSHEIVNITSILEEKDLLICVSNVCLIKSIVEVGQEQGIINPTEREMIDGVISFDDVLAEEVMTPRTEVFMIDVDEPDEDFETLMQMRYSRVPVYEGDIDNIIGILYIKDFFLEAYKVGFDKVDIRSILRPAYFIPERKNINDLFLELKNSRYQMAVLIDEYGGFTGIVTMEDLIEEVMGEIDDEYDKKTNPAIKKIDDRHFIATGSCEIEDVNNACNLKLDENSEDYDTLGGMLMYLLGYIPNDGEKLTVEDNGVIYNILSIHEHRVKKVRIVLPKEEVVENDEDEEKDSEK